MGKKKNRSKKSSASAAAKTVPASTVNDIPSGDLPQEEEPQSSFLPDVTKRQCPVSHSESKPRIQEDKEDQAAFLSQVKSSIEQKPQVIEKVIEKIVEDPKLKKEVSVLKEENAALLKKIESLEKEKAVLESRIESQPSPPSPAPTPKSPSTPPSDEESKRRLSQLEEENKTLNEKVAHYQDVLGNTESLLKSLQVSVENEEAIWQGRLTQSDSCVRELKKENVRLSQQLSELQSSLDKGKETEEMEQQLVSLKEKLGKEEDERKTLETKLQKEEQLKLVLQEQLKSAQEQIKLLPVSQVVSNSNGPANGLEEQEISSLRSQ